MGDSDAISGSSTVSMPRWLSKTHSRYDPDDIAFSPPSDDGATFFSFHVGQSPTTQTSGHKSTFDKINEELGLSEIAGEPRIGLGSSLLSSGGVCLVTELQDERIEHQSRSDHQKHLAPITTREGYDSATGYKTFNPITAAAKKLSEEIKQQQLNKDRQLVKPGGDEDLDLDEKDVVFPLRDLHDFENLDSSNNFPKQMSSTVQKQEIQGLFSRIRNLVPRTADSTPQGSPKVARKPAPLRKTSDPSTPCEQQQASTQPQPSSGDYLNSGGILTKSSMMPSYNNFFFRPTESDTTSTGNSTPSSAGNVALNGSSTAVQQAADAVQKQQHETAKAAAAAAAVAATPTHRMRRPKPSRLREMNFWAPTSM